jgi:hypothetical protein
LANFFRVELGQRRFGEWLDVAAADIRNLVAIAAGDRHRLIGRPARTASFRHRSINRNSAVASGSSFFNGWRATPRTTPPHQPARLAHLDDHHQSRDRIKRG